MRKYTPLLILYCLLMATYLIFFRGIFFSGDELLLFDMTESFARRGNFNETLTYSLSPQRATTAENIFASAESYEPLQPILASPLFFMAQAAPDMNLMHAVWLFNVLVIPLIALVFYGGVRVLGYDSRTAWWSALVLGTGTLLFPYSRTFFREPLMTLFITATLVLALAIQQQKSRFPIGLVGLLAGSFVLAMFSKEVSLLFLPAIVLLLLRGKMRNWFLLAGGGVMVLAGLLLLQELGIAGSNRFSPSRWSEYISQDDLQWVSESTRGYLYSPGRSFFIFSPVLFLSPWGMWLLYKSGQWRLVLSMIGTFVAFAAGYGFLRNGFWSGGISIGPRYLLPLIPLFMFSIVPIIDQIRQATTRVWWHYAVGGWILLSVGIQLLFASYNEIDYYDGLTAENVLGYDEGIWTIEYSPVWRYASAVDMGALPVFWRYDDLWPVVAVLLLLLIGTALVIHQLRKSALYIASAVAMPVVLLGIIVLVMHGIEDERFDDAAVDTIVAIERLKLVTDKKDVIALKDDRYLLPFAATYDEPALIVTLPYMPGEIYSPNHIPDVAEGTISQLMGRDIVNLYQYIDDRYDRLWLVTYFSEFHTFAIRPEERYLAENYYPLERINISDNMHLVSFYMQPAPQGAAAIPTDITFGDWLTLEGYDLPDGDTYETGDFVPVSLRLAVNQNIDRDYTISFMLANESGAVVEQYDSQPVGGFDRMSQWQPGEVYRDSRALTIPDDLPPGDYTLQIIVYYWENLERLPVLDASGNSSADIAILQTITVR